MTKFYYPCLKLKINEIGALKNIEKSCLSNITPVFDIPRNIKDGDSEKSAMKYINNAIKKMDKWWNKSKPFAIDCYDLPTLKDQAGNNIYKRVLETLESNGYNLIPVVALNRDRSHNDAVQYLYQSKKYEKIILRLDLDDISDYSTCSSDIEDIFAAFSHSRFVIFLDIRFIKSEKQLTQIKALCEEFVSDFKSNHSDRSDEIVVSSSSIPAYVSKPNSQLEIHRHEKDLYYSLKEDIPDLIFSDYGIIGPDYTDALIPDHLMQEVSTPKLIYTSCDVYHVFKGGSFKRHERARNQFHDLADNVCKLDCFRGPEYSTGDKFIYSKSITNDNPSSQGHWYQHLNIAHMTYIIKSFL